MSEDVGQPWGFCAAFGCPLLGTVGSEGRWYCFCHVNKPSNFNDAITRELREKQQAVVDVTLALRRDSIHGNRSRELSAARVALKSHPMAAELAYGKHDGNSYSWLVRLEAHLLASTGDIGVQKRIPTTVQTADVPVPSAAEDFFPPVAAAVLASTTHAQTEA